MTCFHPLIRVCDHGPEREGGKSETLKIFQAKEKDLERIDKLNEAAKTAKPWETVGWREGFSKTYFKSDIEYQRIPCGKCIGCRLDYSKNGQRVAS